MPLFALNSTKIIDLCATGCDKGEYAQELFNQTGMYYGVVALFSLVAMAAAYKWLLPKGGPYNIFILLLVSIAVTTLGFVLFPVLMKIYGG